MSVEQIFAAILWIGLAVAGWIAYRKTESYRRVFYPTPAQQTHRDEAITENVAAGMGCVGIAVLVAILCLVAFAVILWAWRTVFS